MKKIFISLLAALAMTTACQKNNCTRQITLSRKPSSTSEASVQVSSYHPMDWYSPTTTVASTPSASTPPWSTTTC